MSDDTLTCMSCERVLPDGAFWKQKDRPTRRNRASHCIECRRSQRDALSGHSGVRVRCPMCEKLSRTDGQYVCSSCAVWAPMFNHTRPPEMQGRAVPIISSWGSGNR